jgi:hypothetical protein
MTNFELRRAEGIGRDVFDIQRNDPAPLGEIKQRDRCVIGLMKGQVDVERLFTTDSDYAHIFRCVSVYVRRVVD